MFYVIMMTSNLPRQQQQSLPLCHCTRDKVEIDRRDRAQRLTRLIFSHVTNFLADLVTSMAIADVSAQMRRGIVERELGYYRSTLRGEVSDDVFAVL